jgi:2,3-bisphosphoglycerate-independent phosphoglycerate mutase
MSTFGISKRALLVICDGLGYSSNTNKNAVRDAKTPHLDEIWSQYPFTTIEPGGELVGLPKGVAGNSEVGHMNIGAGRPVRQDLVRINEAIENNTLRDMPKMQELMERAHKTKKVHLMGLLSDGGVHSHINHLKEICSLFHKEEIQVYLHAFMDGRDTPKTNGVQYIEEALTFKGLQLASVQGRSIGMDRDRRWEKIQTAYDMMIGKKGIETQAPLDYIKTEYEKDIYDEFITPALFNEEAKITSSDIVFFFNFRPDRAKQISTAFVDKSFKELENETIPSYFLCMTPYIDEEYPEVPILFNKEKIKGTLSEYVSKLGLKQLKIAETEKYAHVTYFLNGGEEKPFSGEERILVESPREVATYDLKPEMSADEVLEKLSLKLQDQSFSLYVVNFANPDMVGHTGNYEAAIKAVEKVDQCLGKLKEICLKENISMLVTADHGNCDEMVYADGSPQTSHSKAKVPFSLITSKVLKDNVKINNENNNALKDIAPTLIHLMGLEKPVEFSGDAVFL